MTIEHTVILGGSSGIGLAAAKALLAKGQKVTITGRNEARLRTAADKLAGDISILCMDAARYDNLAQSFETIGPFDHLVLAFGSGKGGGPFANVKIADVREGFEEKVFPQFACAQAALSHLRKDGSVTFISAVSAQAAMPGTAGLGAANAAIAALVPILAVELRPLRVNCVSPGVVDTPWWDFLSADQKTALFDEYGDKSPVGRVGKPDDIADAIAFLVSNSFMTGGTIVCDGGLRWT